MTSTSVDDNIILEDDDDDDDNDVIFVKCDESKKTVDDGIDNSNLIDFCYSRHCLGNDVGGL